MENNPYRKLLLVTVSPPTYNASSPIIGPSTKTTSDYKPLRYKPQYLEKYLELCEELGDTPGQGEVLGNHAPCHSVLGQLKIATNSFAKEIQISEVTNDTMMKGAVTPIWVSVA